MAMAEIKRERNALQRNVFVMLRSNIIECLSMGQMYPILETNKSPIPWTIPPSGDDVII